MANNYTIVDATEQTTLSAEDIGSSVKVPIVRGTGYLPAVYVTVTRPADTNLQRVLAHIRQAAVDTLVADLYLDHLYLAPTVYGTNG